MIEVIVPKWGLTVEDATISEVLVSVGERVSLDQPLFEAETDKLTTEIPSPADGVVAEIRASEGDTVEPGWVVALIDADR